MESYNTEQEYPQVNFIREGVKIGLINGAFALIIIYGSYFLGLDTFVNVQFITTFIPYMILVLIVYGLQMRRRNGNYLAFRDALQYAFMSYVIAAIMVAIGTYILYNLVDKDLTQKSFDLTIEKTRRIMENLKIDPKEIDRELNSMDKKETSFRNIFLGTGLGLIWDFCKSLLIALVIRREKTVI
jgi:hypothetical protein